MQRHFFLRRNLARLLLRLARWRTVGEVPRRAILVGAPHTSNWDWVLTMLLAWDNNIQIRLLVKDSLFVGPLAWILRATGAVKLDRANPGATIRALLEEAEGDEDFLLGIAAQTGLPYTLAFLDAPSRTVGWGPTQHPTGDVVADMDLIRAFYADKRGIKPDGATTPRLREEDR